MGDTNMNPTDSESMFRSVGDTEVSLDEMLSLACRQGKQDIVELLLESGAKVNYRNKAGNTPLLEACSQGHVNIACLLLEKKADIDAPTETTSDSALTWACTLGNEGIVQLLLEHQADIEHRTRDGCTALMFAALAGHDKVARLLLINEAELNVESDSNKDSPLTFACWKGHQRVVELFLSNGANIEHRTKEGFSPLMFAALGGHTEVARLLLEKSAEVNQPSGSNNDIPLTSACWKGHHDVVELLLCYQSNIEHHTKDGCTPLMLAAREGHLSVAQLLLNHSARVNVPSGSENNIPLTLACWKGHKDVVELLLNYKSNIEHQNKAGCTPLMLAAREGHFEATELLLDHYANLNIPSGSNDDTPLTLACWKGHDEVVSLLLDRQSSINHQTKTGCTPLMEATREGHISVARMLLEAGADVETPDNYGQTPFFMACWKGHAEVANLLLEYGANKDCKTKTGITPFFQACRENHVEVVKLLLDYGCNPSSPFPNSRECPLTLAAEKGFSELAQLLLSRNANVECRTKKGCTPLFLTCKEGFKEIAVMLAKHGAETESTDHRGVTPLLAAFKNGFIEVVDWLLAHVTHLPSDLECQKALMAPRLSDKDVLPQRSKCLELIMKAKKAREQAALKNAQILFEELDAEREKKESRRKATARKKAKRKERKRKEQAEKTAESNKDYDDDDYYEEEEDYAQMTNNIHSDDDDMISQSKRKKKSKNKRTPDSSTHNCSSSSSQPVSSITDNHRTNPQALVQVTAESWEDEEEEEEEESEDEMFVDAPEFPDTKTSTGLVSGRAPVINNNKTIASQEANSSIDINSTTRKAPKPSAKNLKNKLEEGSKTASIPRKNSRTLQNNRSQPESPNISDYLLRTSGDSSKPKEKKPQLGHTKSPEELNDKKRSKLTSWSDSPLNPTSRSLSSSSTGTCDVGRGSYIHVASVDNDEEEQESWNLQLEPGSDWSNEDRNEGFKSQNPTSRTRSWASVSTASASTSSSSQSTATPTLSSTPNSNSLSSKPWHEVSRAITTFQMTVSNSLVGRIIGKKGLKINQIQADSGAQISISRAIPRSVERLITIKGTERSVKAARDLIEEALSTPSKDIEVIAVDADKPQSSSTSSKTQTSSSVPSQTSVNPWNLAAPQHSSSVWGKKRFSDVAPPTLSLLKQGPGLEDGNEGDVNVPARRISLPVKIPSFETQRSAISDNKPDNQFPLLNAPVPVLTSNFDNSAATKESSNPRLSPTPASSERPTPRHSVTLGPLSSVNEREEDDNDGEPIKQRRSVSEPTVVVKPTSSVSPLSRLKREDTPSILPPPSSSASSQSSPVVTLNPQPKNNYMYHSHDHKESSIVTVSAVPSVEVSTVSHEPQPATRTTRTVGIVTPTQAVKPIQRDTTLNSTTTMSSLSTTSANDYLTTPTPNGSFGAIGPPRRSSLPATTANHFEGASQRKLSYAGMHLNPHFSGSLSMVPESYPMSHQREYPWAIPPNPPPPHPHPPPPPPPNPHPPINNSWSNHGGNVDWTMQQQGHEFEQRMRSQSWAGLAPSGGFGGHHPMDYPGPFHTLNHMPPQPPPAHHSSWGKFHPMGGQNYRPPPYLSRPHSSMGAYPPQMSGGFNGTNYGNEGGGFGTNRLQRLDLSSQAHSNHPTNYPPPSRHYSTSNPTPQHSVSDTSSPLSLRQVLGDLEREIFPGETPTMDFMKEESPSVSKRWSVSSVPPNLSSQELSNHYCQDGSSVWDNNSSSLHFRHSVSSSPFHQQYQEADQPLISDLAASWPIWTSPLSNQQQSHSPFLSTSSSNDKGWSSVPDNPPTDLADLMKRLDIAEHIPTLKNREVSLDRLLAMSEEEWKDLLPVGPRVKLMNAINIQYQGDKLTGSDNSSEKSSFLPAGMEDRTKGKTDAATHKCSPFLQ